jgi:hypothetical protein
MSIGSTGSVSFWQQDQSYWSGQQGWSSTVSASDSLISAMSSAEESLGKGLASIANKTALNRVNSQLTSAIQSLLTGSSTSSSSSGAAGTSSSSSGSAGAPAIGTGTAPVTTGTSLSVLGIPAGGSVTVSAGGNTTTYASSGSDTVGNLISAINADYVGNAAVTASLNRNGDLVITGKNDTDTVTVGGVYASNIGFAVGHDTFKPTPATASSSTSASSTAPSATASTSTSRSTQSYSTAASESASSAASLLSASGVGGTLVDMLA